MCERNFVPTGLDREAKFAVSRLIRRASSNAAHKTTARRVNVRVIDHLERVHERWYTKRLWMRGALYLREVERPVVQTREHDRRSASDGRRRFRPGSRSVDRRARG